MNMWMVLMNMSMVSMTVQSVIAQAIEHHHHHILLYIEWSRVVDIETMMAFVVEFLMHQALILFGLVSGVVQEVLNGQEEADNSGWTSDQVLQWSQPAAIVVPELVWILQLQPVLDHSLVPILVASVVVVYFLLDVVVDLEPGFAVLGDFALILVAHNMLVAVVEASLVVVLLPSSLLLS